MLFCDEFIEEFQALEPALQVKLAAHLHVVAAFSPKLGRPQVDIVKGSKWSNMKEIVFPFSLNHTVCAHENMPKKQEGHRENDGPQ